MRGRAERGASRPASGEAVVDDDRRTPARLKRRTSAAVAVDARFNLGACACDRGVQVLDAHEHAANGRRVQHLDIALRDRADAELRVARGADLAGHEHVERSGERLRDLVRDRHTPARQPEHDRVLGG